MEYFRTWVHIWTTCVSTVFVKSYLDVAAHGNFLPESVSEIQILLDLYFLEKAIYELGYELNNRPDWIFIPLEGIRQLLRTDD